MSRLFLLLVTLAATFGGVMLTRQATSQDMARRGTLPVTFSLSGVEVSHEEAEELGESHRKLSGRWLGESGKFRIELDFDNLMSTMTIVALNNEGDYRHKDIVAELTRKGRLLSVKRVQCLMYRGSSTWALIHSGCPSVQAGDQFILSIGGKHEVRLKDRLGAINFYKE